MMHGHEKSDLAIVAEKPVNKAEQPAPERSAAKLNAAEPVERRAGTKGNAGQQSTCRTQSRANVSQALERIRKMGMLAFTPAQADPAVPYLPPGTAIPQQPAHPKPSLYAEWLKLLVPPAQYDKPYPGRLIENRAIDMESAGMRSAIATAGRRATPPSEGARRGYSKWHGRERTGSRDA